MLQQPIYVTEDGLARLKAQLHTLQNEKMLELADQIAEVGREGDYIDNTELQAILNEFELLTRRINELRDTIASAELIAHNFDGLHISIGATVLVRDEFDETDAFMIVGSAEADPDSGRISNVSPLGTALLGKIVGQQITIPTDDGDAVYQILDIIQQ